MVLSELPFSITPEACDPAKTDMEWMSFVPISNQSVAQLIDANLDRAREGLRVVEDWCRFGLQQKDLVVTLKDWRQQLGAHHLEIYKKARATHKDQGIGLNHPAQENRTSTEEIIAANCSRVQEALRVLEEFTRATDPDLAIIASKIRYGLYDLEITIIKSTASKRLRQKLHYCNLCLITEQKKELASTISEALKAGVKMIQFRCKNGSDLERLAQAKELASLCRSHDALFIINDRLDLALAADADGIHLGQDDIPTETARRILGSEKLIGRSTHCLKQLRQAETEGADYLGVGPIFPTKTKPERKPSGISYLKEALEATQLPLFAIGGINSSTLDEVVSAGARKIAVIGAIMNAPNPYETSQDLLRKLP